MRASWARSVLLRRSKSFSDSRPRARRTSSMSSVPRGVRETRVARRSVGSGERCDQALGLEGVDDLGRGAGGDVEMVGEL